MKKLRFLYLAGVAALMVASSCSEEQTVMGGAFRQLHTSSSSCSEIGYFSCR